MFPKYLQMNKNEISNKKTIARALNEHFVNIGQTPAWYIGLNT